MNSADPLTELFPLLDFSEVHNQKPSTLDPNIPLIDIEFPPYYPEQQNNLGEEKHQCFDPSSAAGDFVVSALLQLCL